MNTHLHLLEAYAESSCGYGMTTRWRERLRELLRIFLDQIIDPETPHFRMFSTKNGRTAQTGFVWPRY